MGFIVYLHRIGLMYVKIKTSYHILIEQRIGSHKIKDSKYVRVRDMELRKRARKAKYCRACTGSIGLKII